MTVSGHKIYLVLIISLLLFSGNAEAIIYWCQTGRSPGSVTGNVNYGTSINWANPNRSIGSDNSYAHTTMTTGDITKYLEDKTFSFSIPSDATVTGVAVFIERYCDAGADIHDYSIRLEINGSVVGNDVGTPHALWTSTETTVQYGSMYDSWGLSLTPADVNASTFGVLTSVYIPSGGSATIYQPYIDNVEVLIYFQTFGTTCGIYNLPVEMAGFKAKVEEESKVKLTWLTYSEINNDYFTVERSADGMNYEPVTRINGKGNSTVLTNYETMDTRPLPGTSYYRIKQTDYDGKETIEKNVQTVFVSGRDSPFTVYPNPGDGYSFSYSVNGEKEYRIIIQDYSGKEVANETIISQGTGAEIFYLKERLRPGVYTITKIGALKSFREKLLVSSH